MEFGRSRNIDLNLAPQLVQELAASFKFFDRNGDGRICRDELSAVVRSLRGRKVSDADLDNLMRAIDTNGDGFIDLEEFMDLNTWATDRHSTVIHSPAPERMQSDMLSAFHVFDVDKNGFISAEELHFVLSGFGDGSVSVEDCRAMIQCVDEDGDDMVNFQEFQALMNGSSLLFS